MNLPLTNNPAETFTISIGDVVYNMRQIWNTTHEFWALDIADVDGNDIIAGVKLVTQTPLLAQYTEIPFDLESEADEDPTRDNLDLFNLVITLA